MLDSTEFSNLWTKEDKISLVQANLRILLKSFRLAWRAQKRFWAFIIVYFVLIGMVTYLMRPPAGGIEFGLAFIGGVLVAVLYGFLLATFRKNEIATLKCIGWSNGNIRVLILGEILLISLLAFFLFLEVGVHISGISYYLTGSATGGTYIIPPSIAELFIARDLLPITFFIVVVAQIPGILLSFYRALRVKPMEALRMQ